jgi:hypothetical protein
MVPCAYCEKPLECDACRAEFRPADPEIYRQLSWPEQPVACPGCGQVLVCRWCKAPYDGQVADAEDAPE